MAKKTLKILTDNINLIPISNKMVDIKNRFFLLKELTLSRNFSKTASLANKAPKRNAGVTLRHNKGIYANWCEYRKSLLK